jgi:hypothetical protein
MKKIAQACSKATVNLCIGVAAAIGKAHLFEGRLRQPIRHVNSENSMKFVKERQHLRSIGREELERSFGESAP